MNMDFIIGLPRTCRPHNSIWVLVDRMTERISCQLTLQIQPMIMLDSIFGTELRKLHGVPLTIISDRGT